MELELDHFKEARWMFNKALQALPLHMDLWRDVSDNAIHASMLVSCSGFWWFCIYSVCLFIMLADLLLAVCVLNHSSLCLS